MYPIMSSIQRDLLAEARGPRMLLVRNGLPQSSSLTMLTRELSPSGAFNFPHSLFASRGLCCRAALL